MQTVTLNVKGMSCNHCKNAVENAVRQAGARATVDLAGGTVAIEYDEAKVTLDQLKRAIEDQGYDVVSD